MEISLLQPFYRWKRSSWMIMNLSHFSFSSRVILVTPTWVAHRLDVRKIRVGGEDRIRGSMQRLTWNDRSTEDKWCISRNNKIQSENSRDWGYIYTIAKNNFVISLLESQGIIKDKKITEEDMQLPTDILFFSRKFLVSFPSYFLFSSSSLSLSLLCLRVDDCVVNDWYLTAIHDERGRRRRQ